MRIVLISALICLHWVIPARAGTLATAEISLGFGGYPEVVIPADGASGTSVSASLFHLDAGNAFAGLSAPTGSVPGFGTGFGLHQHVKSNLAGTFSGATPAAVVGGVPFAADIGLGTGFALFNIGTTNTGTIPGLPVTVSAFPWRVGAAVITGVTTFTTGGGLATGATVTRSGSNALSPGGLGTVVLIAPMRVRWGPNILNGLQTNFQAGFASLTLTFVPEPGTTVLLCVAAAGLAIHARRRHTRPRHTDRPS